jgi:hypothetical protein
MPLNEIDVIRACAKRVTNVEDILGEQAPTQGIDAHKELLRAMYKVWSGFTKCI